MGNFFNRYKTQIIVFIVVYILIDIFVVGALFVSGLEIPEDVKGFEKTMTVFENFMPNLTNPFGTIGKIFSSGDKIGEFFSASFYTLIAFIILIIVYIVKNGKKHEYDGTEHGSSDWSKNGEQFRKLPDGSEILNKKDGFIVGKGHYIGTDQRKVKINKNILVVGGSGAGKSACYIKPNILQKLGSYVITDPKGELYRETSGFLKNAGYKVKSFNLVNTEYSDRYNPLAHIKDHKDVDDIAHTIVVGKDKGNAPSDPFWNDTATMLLKACIYYVISVLPPEEQNLSSCMNIVRLGGNDETVMDKLFIDELKPEHPGRKEYESIRLGADKTKQSIAISLISKLKDFDSPNIQRITTDNDFDFEQLGREKMAIYVITPPDSDTYDYLLTVFFTQLLQRLFSEANKRGGTLAQPVYLLLDEFANIGQIPDFNKKLSTTRSYGISISIVVQSLDQLEALYKDNYENIIGNCDTQLFLGSQSLKTCEYFSKSLGQKTIKFTSKSVSKDKEGITTQGINISDQRQGRELLTVDELKRLDPDKEIILIRGVRPILTNKYWYFKSHPLREMARQTEIRDISQMPKQPESEIHTMDVYGHLKQREDLAKEKLNKNNEMKVETKPIIPKTEEVIEFDLQKELERKFDELFGESENN